MAGSFSSKKYYANQDNINHFTQASQRHTYIDLDYAELASVAVPAALADLTDLSLFTVLPEPPPCTIDPSLPVYVYHFYNLDPGWDQDVQANRILLLEPSFFQQYPVSDKVLQFVVALAQNIPGIQVFTGGFYALQALCKNQVIHYKEHPTTTHYSGVQHQRDWLFAEVSGFFSSFSGYWKRCEKYIGDLAGR